MQPLGMWTLGFQELLLVLLIVLLLFGARRIPDLARGLGEGIRNFRSAMRGEEGRDRDKGDRNEPPGGSGR